MIITAIIILTVLLLAITVLSIVGAIGAGFIVIFGDLIVFGLIIWLIVKLCKKFKKK